MKSGLYINIPFCKSKCGYCDYITVRDYKDYSALYINALIREMNLYKNRQIKTVYIGGGTPSLLHVKLLGKLIDALNKIFKIDSAAEFTIEINPDDATVELYTFYKKSGINRVSLGIQSFNNHILEFLKRRYSSEKAIRAAELTAAEFDNFSIDILFAIPEVQTIQILQNDLQTALKYNPKHLAVYDLVIENKTYLGFLLKNKKIQCIDDELYVEYYKLVYDYLTKNQFNHYEISSYALNNFECRHNLIYWRNEEYIGLGASAHSYLNRRRQWNYKFPAAYIQSLNSNYEAVEDSEILNNAQLLGETIMLNLHLAEGINIKKINTQFKIDFTEKFKINIQNLLDNNLIEYYNNAIRLTFKGKLFANIVATEFLP